MKFFTFVVLLTSVLFAKEYTKNDRIHDMQIMSEAMSTIGTGFYYNNKDLVISGANKLIYTIKRVKLPKDKKYSESKIRIAKKSIEIIQKKAKIIIDSFEQGKVLQAVKAHSKITNRCMECHTHVRKLY